MLVSTDVGDVDEEHDVSGVCFVDVFLEGIFCERRGDGRGVCHSGGRDDTVSNGYAGKSVLFVALSDREVEVEGALVHSGNIIEGHGDGHCTTVVIADDGVVAENFFALECVGLALGFGSVIDESRCNGYDCILDKEFSGDIAVDCSGYTFTYYFKRIGIGGEVIGHEGVYFLTTRSHDYCRADSDHK